MSIEAKQATPHWQLISELMDSRIPKTEREHAAAREIERLRAAIAEAAMQRLTDVQQEMEQKPVAWMLNGKFYTGKELSSFTLTTKEKINRIPFYTHPPRREWVGLTDEEIRNITGITSANSDWNANVVMKWCRAIEQALRTKNEQPA